MDLITKASELKRLQSETTLFKSLNNLDAATLTKLELRFNHQDIFRPVNFLRFLVARLLIQGVEFSREKLEVIKSAIQERNILDFYPEASDTLLKSVKNYKLSEKGMFPQWKEPFPILYQFFYSDQEKQGVLQTLRDFGNQIINEYNLKNSQVHVVGFDGPQNYGSDIAWGAIIPADAQSVQHAFQLFFGFNSDGVTGGIYCGHKISDIPFIKETKQSKTWDEYLTSLEDLIPKWKDLNSKIDFSLQEEESKFLKRIKSFDPQDINVLFNVLDWLIADLELADGENLVFSTGSKQLSFHVGKRYCLILQKTGFGFIAPEGTEVPNARNSSFDGSQKAAYINETSAQNLLNFYTEVATAVQFEIERDNHVKEKEYDNPAFRKAAFDREYLLKFFDFKEIDRPVLSNRTSKINSPETMIPELNQIFFGPPGTGKTFSTVSESVKIADPVFYNSNQSNRDAIKRRFNDLLIKDLQNPSGQIAFCTFHQSFSYEDFVEGIKPETTGNNELIYKIDSGIFKKVCELADANEVSTKIENEGMLNWSKEIFNQANFWKISLGDTSKKEDSEIYKYCIQEGEIALGFTREIDFTENHLEEIKSKCQSSDYNGIEAQQVNYFVNELKNGDYIFVSKGNKYVRAFGRVTGKYEFKADSEINYQHFRRVEWIFENQLIPVESIYDRSFSQKTMYALDKTGLKEKFFIKTSKPPEEISKKNYVLIIDEINRGNVSSIFGEIITLLEKDKRKGMPEKMTVTLPYSKAPFMVPSNVYLIGTMNTADRSIEALDTALRRRFSFREISSKPELLRTEGKIGKEKNGNIEGIDLVLMLEKINERIEKLIDKDHKIGHAYFMDDTNKFDLQRTFKNKVIPLLEEYFFGDFGKIGLVLGSSFICADQAKEFDFAEFKDYDKNIQSDLKQRKIYKILDEFIWDFISIYKPLEKP